MTKKANNEGSIYKDKQGHWRGVVTVASIDGKPKKKYFYGKTKKEVSDKVNALLLEIKNKTYIEPCRTTLYGWLYTWLKTYCMNNIRATTLVNYETYIHRHIKNDIGNIKLSELTSYNIQLFYNNKIKNGRLDGKGGISPKTLKNMHNMLHNALKQAVYLEMIPKNPAEFITLPKAVKNEMRYFTVEEQQKLQEYLKGERLGTAILLDLYTGLRQGELLGLKWENVHIDLNGESYIKVVQTINRVKNYDNISDTKTIIETNEPKTPNSKRIIPLIKDIAVALTEHRKRQENFFKENNLPFSEYVFTSTNGNVIDPRSFQIYFKRLLKRVGIREINVHGLRHTFATRALESGMAVKTLSQILGHTNVAFTLQTYTHITESLKSEALNQMDYLLIAIHKNKAKD